MEGTPNATRDRLHRKGYASNIFDDELEFSGQQGDLSDRGYGEG